MATLREVKKRIKSVQSTRRITKAMEMVAAAKLRRAQQRVEQAKPYARKLDEILSHLAQGSTTEITHPYFEERPVRRKTLVVIVSDRGLCGSYNTNVFRRAEEWLEKNKEFETEIVAVGKRANEYFLRHKRNVIEFYGDWNGLIDYPRAYKIAAMLAERFVSGGTDRIDFIFTRFLSTSSHHVVVEEYLPVARPEGEASESAGRREYIFEPSPQQIYAALMPGYVNTKMVTALVEAFASEHGSRMMAMQNATRNAAEMVDTLTLDYNKARQAQITNELLEVVSGAEALKG